MSTIADVVGRIELESVSGSGLASGPVGDAQRAPFLPQRLQGVCDHVESLGLCRGAEEFPRALALERARWKALVARGPQQAAPGIMEAACACVCWSAVGLARRRSATGQAKSCGWTVSR